MVEGPLGVFPVGRCPSWAVGSMWKQMKQWRGSERETDTVRVWLCGDGDGPGGAGCTAHCGCVWPSSRSPGDNRLKTVTDKGAATSRCDDRDAMLTLPTVANCLQW